MRDKREMIPISFSDSPDEAAILELLTNAQGAPGLERADQELVYDLMPDLRTSNNPRDTIRLLNSMDAVRRYRMAHCGLLGKFLSAEVNQCRLVRKSLSDLAAEKGRAESALQRAESDLRAATERNGIHATEDKRELANARTKIEKLEADIVAFDKLRSGLDDEIARLIGLGVKTEAVKATAYDSVSAAVEKLEERFPKPTPFIAAIIEDLKRTQSELKPKETKP